MRRSTVRAAVAGLMATLVVTGWAAAAFGAPPPPPPPLVATESTVKEWFLAQEEERIALNDALQAAYDQLAQAATPGAANGCAELLRAVDAMLALPPPPKRALMPLVVAGLGQFRAGAQQCLAGNAEAARASLLAGAEVRADAELEIDEILESPNASVD